MTCGSGGCGGGFGGCGFATGIGNYTKPATCPKPEISTSSQSLLFRIFVGWIIFVSMVVSGLLIVADIESTNRNQVPISHSAEPGNRDQASPD